MLHIIICIIILYDNISLLTNGKNGNNISLKFNKNIYVEIFKEGKH